MANEHGSQPDEFYNSHIDSEGKKMQDVAAFLRHIDKVIDDYRAGLMSRLDSHVKTHASHTKGELLFEVPQSKLFSELEARGMHFNDELKIHLASKKRSRFAVLVREEGKFYPRRDFLRFTLLNHYPNPTVRVYLTDQDVDLDKPLEPKKSEPSYKKIMDAFQFDLNEPRPMPSLIKAWSSIGELIYKRQVSLDVIKAKIKTRLIMNELFYQGFKEPHILIDSIVGYIKAEKDHEKAERTMKMLRTVVTDVFCCNHDSWKARHRILKIVEKRCRIENRMNPASHQSIFLSGLVEHLKKELQCEHDEAPFRLSSKVAKYLQLAKEKFPLSPNSLPSRFSSVDAIGIRRH